MLVSSSVELQQTQQQKWQEASPSHRIRKTKYLSLLGKGREKNRIDFISAFFLPFSSSS